MRRLTPAGVSLSGAAGDQIADLLSVELRRREEEF